ncbi:MAG TPA: septal ring lytic transglycosylase RlpA family protein [Pusillimonas sp.]|uniref:septal ring lytic transglycosylase RlpA family protein n=1 Tax=Pusillimonas sp. TaxID=3040095 RepID=UPI002CA2934A|nr:septal ring lytic transglycosylase RlpA family protein [Pusillimonas sp.]HUH87318.1 septal ring lytic transglycosylase RlpA family protein [Pusillimonas sp.]
MTTSQTLIASASLACLLILAGCGSTGKKGGYYKDDGPGSDIPADILNTPDAVPRIETHAPANMRPYRVLGRTYVPITSDRPFSETGVASWYGRKFHGRKTANGETYDMYAMTAAHPTLPLPSYARVTRPETGATVVVRINDRGPFHSGRVIDLSYAAAARLGLVGRGSAKVRVDAITHADIARGQTTRTVMAEPAPRPALATQNEAAAVQFNEAADLPDALAALGVDSTSVATATPVQSHAVLLPYATLEDTATAGVFLQFGAFSGRANAESLAKQLNSQISMTETRPAQVRASENLYRVQIGPYATRTEAINAALRIQQQTGSQATVATRD